MSKLRNTTQAHRIDRPAQERNMAAEREARRAINRQVREQRRLKGEYDPPEPVSIRPISIDDAAHVIDSWTRSFQKSATVGPIERSIFAIEQRARIDRLIRRSKTFVACDRNDRTVIRGWIVFEPPRTPDGTPVVHFVCVHPRYQLCGIGTQLVELARRTHTDPDAPMWCTHDTCVMRHCRAKWNLLYNPYLLEQKATP